MREPAQPNGTSKEPALRVLEPTGSCNVDEAMKNSVPADALKNWKGGEQLSVRVGMTIREAEKVLVAATLEHTDGCISKAAAILGIDRSTLYVKIKRYGLSSWHP
jgi:transcriptional regulator of acetoin/glycerol metabolism